jgi:thioredoxin reductase (NADPH)
VSNEQLIIIGSGPAGYTAAIYAARAGLKPLVLAGSVTAGGALMNTTEVENFPGFPSGIQGPELMDGLQEQAEKFGARIVFDDVTEVDLKGHVKRVVTGGGETHEAPAVILATGSAYKELGLPERRNSAGTVSPGVPPVTVSSSANRTSLWLVVVTPPWKRPPS